MSKRSSPQTVPQQQNANAKQGAGGKLKINYDKLKKGDVVAICKSEGGYTQTEVNSNTQIHQKSMSPLSPTGDFHIECHDALMCSNFILSSFQKTNEVTGQVENLVSLKTFVQAFGNYEVIDADGNHTTDEIGEKYVEMFKTVEESVAESIDANTAHKKRLFGLLKFGAKQKAALEAPTLEAMEPFLHRKTVEDTTSEAFGEIDMSLSPAGGLQLWIGVPKVPSITDFKIPGTNLVIWTRIFDDTERISSKPISSWAHLMRHFVYEKGDSLTKGKRPFRFLANFTLLAPSLYINSEKKVGRMQYKLAEIHINQIDHPKARNTMSDEQIALQRETKMKGLSRFVINSEAEINDIDENQTAIDNEQQQQQQQQQYYGQHYDGDDGQNQQAMQQSEEAQEFESMIEADQEIQRVTKKGKYA